MGSNRNQWMSVMGGMLLGLVAAAAPSDRLFASGTVPVAAATAGPGAGGTVQPGRQHALRLAGGQRLVVSADGRQLQLRIAGAPERGRDWPLVPARRNASLTALPDGRVLLWGGQDAAGSVQRDGVWFDPDLRMIEPALGLPMSARSGHTATVLTDGRVLFVGGHAERSSGELWTPATGKWTALDGASIDPGHRAMLRADGEVLIATVGADLASRRGLLFDPVNNTLAPRGQEPQASAVAEGLAGAWPEHGSVNVTVDATLGLRFSDLVRLEDLNPSNVTLFGPGGSTSLRITAAEDGRLAFVHPMRQLFPDAPYTLLVKGVMTRKGEPLPLMSVDFRTAALASPNAPAPSAGSMGTTAPTTWCQGRSRGLDLCQSRGAMEEGIWTPGQDNAGENWRLPGRQPEASYLGFMPKIFNAWGKSALTGTVLRADGAPVAGVAVSVGSIAGYTNAQGQFLLYDVPKGRQRVYVDGTAANGPGLEYGQFVVGVDVQAKGLTQVPFTMWLPRIAQRDKIQISSPTTREQVLTHPDLPGMELRIPAGTVIRDQKGKIVTEVAIVPTPVNRSPYPLPTNFPMYFTLQPGGAVLQGLTPEAGKGARVIYPNYDKHPEGTPADFWLYDAMEGWRVYGQGRVNREETQFIPEPGVALHEVVTFGAAVSPNDPAPEEGMPPDDQECGECNAGTGNNATAGDPIDLRTGRFTYAETDIAITDVLPITLGRNYRPSDYVKREFGLGTAAGFMYRLSQRNNHAQLQLVLPNGTPLTFNQVSGSGAYGTWRYSGRHAFAGATIASESSGGWKYRLTMRDGSQMTFEQYSPNRIKTYQDRFGNVIEYQYDAGNVSRILSPNGRYIDLNYDTQNRIISAVDPLGSTWRYEYDARGMLATVTYPDATTRRYNYKAYGTQLATHPYLTTIHDQRGNRLILNEYEEIDAGMGYVETTGRVVKQTLADGAVYLMQYDHVDGNSIGTLVTHPDGSQRRVRFQSGLYPVSDTLAYGTPVAQVYHFERDGEGRMTASVDPLGRRTEYVYDSVGGLTRMTRLAGTDQAVTTQATYAPDGQLASLTDQLGKTTRYEYNQGCLSAVIDRLGNITRYVCDGTGQISEVTDPLTGATQIHHMGGDVVAMNDSMGRVMAYRHDSLGRIVAREFPDGAIERKEYDALGRVVRTIGRDGGVVEYAYDANGNITDVLLPHGAGISYEYDVRDRVIARTDSLGGVERWSYDTMSRQTSYTDRRFLRTLYHYDVHGRLASATYHDGDVVTADYDGGNRRTRLTDSASGSLVWTYDSLDRITMAGSPQGDVLYSYDAAGRRTAMKAANQLPVTYNYDDSGRLLRLQQGDEQVGFGYDAADRLVHMSYPNGVESAYSYNAAGDLTGLAWRKPGNEEIGAIGFGYDTRGHLVAQTGSYAPVGLPATSSSGNAFDDNLRQTHHLGQQLEYDGNGNLIADSSRTFEWGARNQLVRIREGGQVIAEFSYDALGRRVGKTENGRDVSYLHDGFNVVQETTGSHVNPILTGLHVDQRFARDEAGVRTYLLTDHLGSTRALANSDGHVINRYDYDPYGAPTQSASGFTNPYQFTGRERDESGLYYYRARYYQPDLGRFVSEDPIGLAGGLNPYAYVGGSPVSWGDPFGLSGTLGIYSQNPGGTGGHSWLTYTPDSPGQPGPGGPGGRNGPTSSYGTWGNNPDGKGNGLHLNIEMNRGHVPDVSRTSHLSDEQERKLFEMIQRKRNEGEDGWGYLSPCSTFAADTWEAVTGESLSTRTGFAPSAPTGLSNSIRRANGGAAHGRR